jgi:hypothetical protein
MNSELERIRKAVVRAWFQALSKNVSGETDEATKTQSG